MVSIILNKLYIYVTVTSIVADRNVRERSCVPFFERKIIMLKEELIVSSYRFSTLEDALLARKELEKIQYLEERLNYDNPKSILLIYKKTIETKTFQTPVGLEFLLKLRKFLLEHEISQEDIDEIPLNIVFSKDVQASQPQIKTRIVKVYEKPEPRKFTMKISMTMNLILVVLLISMFVIALTSSHPNILNYEKVITNKYASWEQELRDLESELRNNEYPEVNE